MNRMRIFYSGLPDAPRGDDPIARRRKQDKQKNFPATWEEKG